MNFLKNEIVEKYGLLEPVERGSYKCEDIKTILMEQDKAIDNFRTKLQESGKRISISVSIKVLHKMIITAMYRMDDKR